MALSMRHMPSRPTARRAVACGLPMASPPQLHFLSLVSSTRHIRQQPQPQHQAPRRAYSGASSGGNAFASHDVLGGTPAPATVVDACTADGFALGSGLRIRGGLGTLLVGGEAFSWRPWRASSSFRPGGRGGDGSVTLVNERGQWELPEGVLGLLGAVWPRPDLLILGTGPRIRPLSPRTRKSISDLGMRVEALDTWNAASQYNLLATERGVYDVAAALVPLGWKEGLAAT